MSQGSKGITRRKFMEISAMGGAAALLPISSVFGEVPKRGGTLNCAMQALIRTPDPHRFTGTYARQAMALSWEGLTQPISAAERRQIVLEKGPEAVPPVKPMLAENWDIEKGGTRYVFHLKKNVKFHNGKEFDSEDIVWNWKRMSDPRSRSVNRKFTTQYIKSMETPDRYTVVADLKQPYGAFLLANAWMILAILPKGCIPEGAIWGQTPTFKPSTPAPPGTGPFKCIKFQSGLGAEFERFDDYRIHGLPYLDKVNLRVVTKDQPRTMAFRAGNYDYIYNPEPNWFSKIIAENEAKAYQTIRLEKDKLNVYAFQHTTISTIYLNCLDTYDTPFKDVRVRKAMALCLDREQLMKTLYGSIDIPMHQSFHADLSPNYFPDLKWEPRDTEKAKRLLKEAGYPNGLDVEFKITPVWGRQEIAAQIIQQMAKPAGFRIKIVPIVGTQYGNARRKFTYQMIHYHVGREDPMQYYYQFFHTDPAFKGYAPVTGIKDPTLDKLIDAMAQETDIVKRRAKFRKVLDRCMEQAYVLPYGTWLNGCAWSDKVKNFKPEQYYIPERGLREAWMAS